MVSKNCTNRCKRYIDQASAYAFLVIHPRDAFERLEACLVRKITCVRMVKGRSGSPCLLGVIVSDNHISRSLDTFLASGMDLLK